MNYSAEQLAIFDWFKSGAGNLVVRARAGTGKTTTIKAAFEHATDSRILYAVFNKRNQKEAEEKITDPRVQVKTLHSLGFAFLKKFWPGCKPDQDVEWDRAVAAGAPADDNEVINAVLKVVGMGKNLFLAPTLADLAEVCGFCDVEPEIVRPSRAYDIAEIALRAIESSKVKDPGGRISFDDMVWLPVALNIVRPWFNLVVVDEAQDMNAPQLAMARKAVANGGRVVIVGDDRQAIYGFRGAVQDGIGKMKVLLRATELSLTTTYRCPKKVVAIASAIVPDYTAAPSAPEGETGTVTEFAMMSKLTPGDAIISRLNAPLMPLALSLLRRNVPARIEGRDIGKQLSGMVRSMRAKGIPDFIAKVQAWLAKQHERLAKAKNAEKRLEQASDIAQTLIALAEGCDTVPAIETRLASLFQDTDSTSKPAVVLSSTHKAKGLEWHNVYLLAETFRQSRGGEEANIYYVAVTRAMRSLWFVGGKGQAEPTTATKAPEAVEPAPAAENPVVAVQQAPAAPSAPVPGTSVPAGSDDGGKTWESPLPGMVYREVGIVFAHNGAEWVVTRLGSANATARCLTKRSKTIKARGEGLEVVNKEVSFQSADITVSRQIDATEVIRRMSAEDLNNFLTGKVRPSQVNKQTGNNDGEKHMPAKKKNNNSNATWTPLTGSSQFVKDCALKGMTKNQTREAAVAKWPQFAVDGRDAGGFESRWNMAEKAVAKAKADAKASTAPAKAPAKKATKKAVKGGKAPARPAKSGGKTPAKSTPPPRPAKVTEAAAPAEAPAPADETPAAE